MRARWPCGPFSVGSFTVGCQGLACCVGGLADTPILLLHAACCSTRSALGLLLLHAERTSVPASHSATLVLASNLLLLVVR